MDDGKIRLTVGCAEADDFFDWVAVGISKYAAEVDVPVMGYDRSMDAGVALEVHKRCSRHITTIGVSYRPSSLHLDAGWLRFA
jgi:hypothetical protein